MQSSSRPFYILPRYARVAAKTRKFIDRLATWILVLALAASVMILMFWLVAWFENSISLAGEAQKPHMPQVVFDVITHCEGAEAMPSTLLSNHRSLFRVFFRIPEAMRAGAIEHVVSRLRLGECSRSGTTNRRIPATICAVAFFRAPAS